VTTTAAPTPRVAALPANGSIERVLAAGHIATGRPVVVLIGGAAKLDESPAELAAMIRDGVVATAQAEGATVVDGGTDSGVMALAGKARAELGATVPLVGVAPIAKVGVDGIAAANGSTALEPNHSFVLLAPGDEWGSEAPWLVNTARIIGGNRPVVAVLVDGGPLALQEAMACAAQGWPLITLAGSGRTADVLAAYASGSQDATLSAARRGAIHVVDLGDGPTALADTLRPLLRRRKPARARPHRTDSPARIDYPALYVAAADASSRGQRHFKRMTGTELGVSLVALSLGLVLSIAVATGTVPTTIRQGMDAVMVAAVALLFLLALLIKFLNRSSSYDDDWFNGRAIAETVKTLSWRYMMRVPPLDGPDADDQFRAELASLVDASAGLRQAVDSLPSRPQQISQSMRTVRERELTDRRDFYVHRRLLEQARWYRRRSAEHHRRATRWFWAAIVFQVLAVVFALMAVAAVVAGQSPDFEAPFLRAMSLLASLAIAVTAWTQLGHDDELSRAYAVSLQELLLIAGAAERATTDGAFAAVVRDGEEAIGRENRGWVAKRAERFKAPDLGAAD
jgi:hypothetical protein